MTSMMRQKVFAMGLAGNVRCMLSWMEHEGSWMSASEAQHRLPPTAPPNIAVTFRVAPPRDSSGKIIGADGKEMSLAEWQAANLGRVH
jgi:hypothetical protein